ncbi:MAG: hypothetical protein HYT72_01240 [Candidatus Aenigmarchaeota archaeon]|nr:hypothetical protein [Candidatus Aenigmarchaeota archaeon]
MARDESKEKKAAKAATAAPAAPAKPLAKGKGVPEPVEEEVKVEKKKEKISQKERPKSKKKHAKVQIWKLYQGGKRKNENCPRCGPGTFLAAFKNRKYCGKCGFGVITTEAKA